MKSNFLIVSVESQKGGVGKTTAALNMARLLHERYKYAVLFIDVDITGTNVTNGLDSNYWKNICHTVKHVCNNNNDPANLLAIFNNCFMTGCGIPRFRFNLNKSVTQDQDLLLKSNKVNVIGSNIFSYDLNNIVSHHTKSGHLICKPNILFDELHAFWFIEFLQEICANFTDIMRCDNSEQPIAIIIDNSPGYVGFASAIKSWLTDLGPQKGKFLIVSSLDRQDLLSCNDMIDNLHRIFENNWNASLIFKTSIQSDSDLLSQCNLNIDEERFFMRLVESKSQSDVEKKESYSSIGFIDSNLSFYKNYKESVGNEFLRHPGKYMGLLINRVPLFIKDENNNYDLELTSNKNSNNSNTILSQLLGDKPDRYKDWMVSYDEYIEFQFIQQIKFRGYEQPVPSMSEFEKRIEMIIEEKRSNILNEPLQLLLHENYKISSDLLNSLPRTIQRLHDAITDTMDIVERSGHGNIKRIIHDEWLPRNILRGFRIAFRRIFMDFGYPFYNIGIMEEDISISQIMHFIDEIEHHTKNQTDIANDDTRTIINRSLSVVLALSIPSQFLVNSNLKPMILISS